MTFTERFAKRALRWIIDLQERRIARLERSLIKSRHNLNRYEEAGLTYLIGVERTRVQYLEADLQKAMKRLKDTQDAYVRAYISKRRRGKTLDDQMKEIEQ